MWSVSRWLSTSVCTRSSRARSNGTSTAAAPEVAEAPEAAKSGWERATEAVRDYADKAKETGDGIGEALISGFRGANALKHVGHTACLLARRDETGIVHQRIIIHGTVEAVCAEQKRPGTTDLDVLRTIERRRIGHEDGVVRLGVAGLPARHQARVKFFQQRLKIREPVGPAAACFLAEVCLQRMKVAARRRNEADIFMLHQQHGIAQAERAPAVFITFRQNQTRGRNVVAVGQ